MTGAVPGRKGSADTDERAQLLELLVSRSYRYAKEGFTLTSGKTSPHYVDCKQTTLDARGAYLCGTQLYRLLAGRGIGTVGGLTLGADPLVTAVSLAGYLAGEPLTAAIVRKAAKGHGTGRWIEGPATTDQKVAVLDDVVTTGKSTVEAIRRFRDAGYEVVAAVSLVDRNEGGREAIADLGLTLEALFGMDDILAQYARKS